ILRRRRATLFPYTTLFRSAGEWMVVEADESDGTFLKLPADVAIVTNVDAEHLDHFKTFAAVQDAFVSRCSASTLVTIATSAGRRSEEHTSELQSLTNLVCR